ncbi:MAG: ribbon-helix-helix domain-containing protein [Acidimicrobiales bacterium]
MTQVIARIDERLANAVDELVAEGVVASRSEAVRHGLEALVDRLRRDQAANKIVEGYQRMPQEDDDLGWSDDATRQMITEEPW